jgi:glycosyltransferase involved in cell wall biosynthesis
MRILVLALTDLAFDTRVKRHLRALRDLGNQVTAVVSSCRQPLDDNTANGLEIITWQAPGATHEAALVQRLAAETGLTNLIFNAFPGALAPQAFDVFGEWSRRLQARPMAQLRWQPLHQTLAHEDRDPRSDYRELCGIFENMLRLAEFACRHPADTVYCVDLPTLPAGVAHQRRHGSRLIFDAHEIYYDMAPGQYTRLWKESLALLEWRLARQADWVFGVSQSHADWMRQTYELRSDRVLCVPNCCGMGQEAKPAPVRAPATPLRIYYHGNSDPYRGLGAIARAVAAVPETQLILRCPPSPALDEARQIAGESVKILPLVGPEELIEAIRSEADVGIHVTLDLPVALNIKVALTNKFIEYLVAGIPVITAPLEEQARLVREHDIGFVLADNSVEAIRTGLCWMRQHRYRLAEMGQRAHEAGLAHFSWPVIRRKLERAFDPAEPRLVAPKHPGDDDIANAAVMAELCQAALLKGGQMADLLSPSLIAGRFDRELARGVNRPLRRRFRTLRAAAQDFGMLVMRRALRASWRTLPASIRARLRS